jgi:DNA-binding NarL/FixJ family response regulator
MVTESAAGLVRVVAVDDHPVVIGALRSWASAHGQLEIVAQLTGGAGVLEAVRTHRADVVLLDYDMPGTDTVPLVEELSKAGVSVVMLSGFVGASVVMACLDAGACGYVSKDNDMGVIAGLVSRAAKGEFVTCATVSRELARKG